MEQYSMAAQPGSVNSVGNRWQHLVIEIDSNEEEHQAPPLQERLDLMGQEGWELVSLTSTTYRPAPGGVGGFGERPCLLLVFKRPLESVLNRKQAEGGSS